MEKKKTATKKVANNKTAKKKLTNSVTIKKEAPKKQAKKKKKGFTLIELLAVIIILGILMIVAIPAVTNYISDSRKSAYVDTAKEIVSATRNIVNEGKLNMYDTSATYYIPASYIKTENASKSPYGEFTKAYVGVIFTGQGYKYYWISTDDAGQGVPNIILADKLENDDIKSDLKDSDISNIIETTGIGGRKTIKILQQDGTWNEMPNKATNYVSEDGEVLEPKVCIARGLYSDDRIIYEYTQGMTVEELLDADIIEFDDGEMLYNYFYDYEYFSCVTNNPYSTATQYLNWESYMQECYNYRHTFDYSDQVINSSVGCYYVSLPK